MKSVKIYILHITMEKISIFSFSVMEVSSDVFVFTKKNYHKKKLTTTTFLHRETNIIRIFNVFSNDLVYDLSFSGLSFNTMANHGRL